VPIIDLATPTLTDTLDTPKGFVVTPGAEDVNKGSDAPSWGKTFGAAFRQDNTVGSFLSAENAPLADEGYNPWDDIKGTKYEQNFSSFVDVRNRAAGDIMKRKIDGENEDRKLLDSAPWYQSLVSQAAAGGLDLPTLIPGGAFVKGAKGGFSVLKSAASVGAAAGISSAVQEGVLQNEQETRSAAESAVNIGASVLLGGLLGAGGAKLLSPGEWQKGVAALEKEVGPSRSVEPWTAAPADRSAYINSKAYQESLHAPYEAADGTKLASSKTAPFEGPLPDVGTWRMDPRKGNYGHEIEVLNKVKLSDVDLPEVRDGKLDPTKMGDDVQYAKWLEEGRRAPPIEVIQRDDGSFAVIDGHRRALAAKIAGADEVEAWVSYAAPTGKTDTNGKPIKTSLTYELVHSGESPTASAPASLGAASADDGFSLNDLSVAGRIAGAVASASSKLNPALRLVHSPSVQARLTFLKGWEFTPYLNMNMEGRTLGASAETRMLSHDGGLIQTIPAQRPAYAEYRKAGGQLTYDQFLEEAGRAARRNDTIGDAHIDAVAKAHREAVIDPLTKEAVAVGLLKPEDLNVTTADSYFHRMWQTAKLVAREPEFKSRVVNWVKSELPKWTEQFDKGVERRLAPVQREIDDLEMTKLRRSEELKQRVDVADTSEMSEGDIRQALRIVNGGAPKPKGVKTLSQFVLEAGGLVDDAGELAHRGITNKVRPGLVRSERRAAGGKGGGWTLDDMARHAWENDYFPEHSNRPSIDEFVEALNDDFHKVRAVLKHGDKDAYKLNELVAQLEADLHRAGVPADGKKVRFSTSEEMKSAVDRVYKALDAEADRKIAGLKERLAERSADARIDRESRFTENPDDLGKQVADDVFNSLTGRSLNGLSNNVFKITAKGPLKDRTFNAPDALFEDFLENNIETVSRHFVKTVAPQVEIQRAFGSLDLADQVLKIREDYDTLRAAAKTEKERLKLSDQEKRDIKDLKDLLDLKMGSGAGDTNYGRVVRAVNNFNYVRQMGEVAFASIPETIMPAVRHGMAPYFETLGQTLTNLKGVRMAANEAQLAGNIGDRVLQHHLASMADLNDPTASRTAVEAVLDNATKIASRWNGIGMLTDMQKTIASVMTQNRVLQNASRYAELPQKERAYMAFLKIDQSMAERIAKQFAEHGDTVEKVAVANTERWTDAEARSAYRSAINLDVNSTILTRSAADVPTWANTNTGKMLGQFKGFALASHQRILLRGLQEDHTRFLGSVAALTIMGMAVTWLKAQTGNRAEKLQEITKNPGWWISEGLDRAGMFAIPVEMVNMAEKAFGVNPIKSPMKAFDEGSAMSQKNQNRNEFGSLLGPSFGLGQDVYTAARIPGKALKGEEITKADKGAVERSIPFNSYFGVRQMLRYVVNPPQ
jgi:hypothetical protein